MQHCHQGGTIPAATPAIGKADETQPLALPGVADLLERHAASTDIRELAAARVVLKGCHAKIVDAQTPRARVIPRAACIAGEILIDGDKAVITSSFANGQSVRVGSDGRRIWTVSGDALRWIPDEDFAQFQRKLNPLLVVRIRPEDFESSSVAGIERIDGNDAYLVNAIGTDGTVQQLWFSKASGLLVRRTFYHPIAFGLNPEQFDLSDYRRFGKMRLPARINSSYLDDQHLGVLKTLTGVTPVAPPSDVEFDPPARWPN